MRWAIASVVASAVVFGLGVGVAVVVMREKPREAEPEAFVAPASPATRPTPAPNKVGPPDESGPEWPSVLSNAKKRAEVASLRAQAENLSIKAEVSSRSAQWLGLATKEEAEETFRALKAIHDKGIDGVDAETVRLAERAGPIDIALRRIGVVRGKADRPSVEGVIARLAGFDTTAPAGYTEVEARRLPRVKITTLGVARVLFERADPPLASDYEAAFGGGLVWLPYSKAIAEGMKDQPRTAPDWYAKRRQAGAVLFDALEGENLMCVCAATGVLPPADRSAFAQRLASVSATADFGPQLIYRTALAR